MQQFIIITCPKSLHPQDQKPRKENLNLFAMTMFLLVLMALISTTTSTRQDIQVAIDEMQKANYFTFVMLINMAPPDLIQGNVTFLMPNNRALAKTTIPESSFEDFLLRHSIPSPLLVEHLEHFPTGSTVPTSRPGFVLRVTNDGRRRFFLNNARIISPNICTKGSSVRCHGVDGVVNSMTTMPRPDIPPPSSCFWNNSNPPPPTPEANSPMPTPSPSLPEANAPMPTPSPSPPEGGGGTTDPVVAPPPEVDHVRPPKKSGSSRNSVAGAAIILVIITMAVIAMVGDLLCNFLL